VYYTQSDNRVDEYRTNLEKNIFACMELAKQSYSDTMQMPVNRFYNFLEWKLKLQEDKQKNIVSILEGFLN